MRVKPIRASFYVLKAVQECVLVAYIHSHVFRRSHQHMSEYTGNVFSRYHHRDDFAHFPWLHVGDLVMPLWHTRYDGVVAGTTVSLTVRSHHPFAAPYPQCDETVQVDQQAGRCCSPRRWVTGARKGVRQHCDYHHSALPA